MRLSARSVIVGIGTTVLALTLVGCTSLPGPAATVSTAPPRNAVTPTPEASTAPVAELAGCDTALDDAGNADLAATNLTPVDFAFQNWDYPLLADFAADGVVCKWAGGGDVFVVIGQLAMDEANWETTQAELEAAGYQQDNAGGVDGFTNGPDGEDESYPSRGFAWRDGILYYASYPGILEFIPAFQI
ncbi:hypothetical protein BJY17_000648 [Agromyces hippuratus]|uniref:Uncharacterized protein n=1 Tax=Agromyces hippuratus TaxID=286438 RepID=A0A852X179_9MICO|nr:hypothetical protein [Agromyces hippuratus]NYG19901.1 hypothetical protein [Agromyces hippuratus]